MEIRDRITELRRVKASEIRPHPGNWRTHPEGQARPLSAVLEKIGYADALLAYTEEDGALTLFDGHLRRDLTPDAEVPVLVTDLTPAEAREMLALLDPLAGLAESDETLLAALKATVAEDITAGLLGSDERLDALLGELTPTWTEDDGDGEEPPLLSRADVPDALFPTDNEWQVPLLDVKRQADAVDLPVVTWGSIARTSTMRGTWHFYTADDRYTALWDDPSPVINSGCVNAVEPNFSCYGQTPRAVALYRIYQKRWIARYWQSRGLRVFVDLNVATAHADLNLLGVPAGWRAYATRGYTERMEATSDEYELACERAGSDDILFLVYGGGKSVAEMCGARGWVHVGEHMDRVKREAQDGEG